MIMEKSHVSREKWSNQLEFLLTCIGYAVGLGNIWRFPFLCMRNGGGAFLIPYFVSLVLCGIPLFVLELAVGQFSSMSPVQVWNLCPLFKGIGYGMVIIPAIACVYFNIIITWSLYYLFNSFAKTLPWQDCGNSWNTPLCLIRGSGGSQHISQEQVFRGNLSVLNTISNSTLQEESKIEEAKLYANLSSNESIPWKSPTEEFWQYETLQLSSGISDLVGIKWDLLGCLFLGWVIVFLCLFKGIKSSGKVVYVTATAPYLFLTILLIRGAMLPGAIDGIRYYIIPDWYRLLDFKVWAEALMQIFYTLGIAWGSLITMASYNSFNSNCVRDGVLIPLLTCLTSFYAGFVMFSVIGFMAHEAGLPVKDVVTSGPGLVFIVYPEALTHLPISPLWAILFFTMLLTVGLDSQFVMFETVVSSISDQYPNLRKRKVFLTLGICIMELMLGIPMVTKGGMYIFQIIDWFCGFSVLFLAVFECVVLSWVYGCDRLYYDIELMTGRKPVIFWKVCWKFVTPILLIMLTIYSIVKVKPPTYGTYKYPDLAVAFGWVIAVAPLVPIPIVIVKELALQEGSMLQRLKASLHPNAAWGPSDQEAKDQYKWNNTKLNISINELECLKTEEIKESQ